MLTNITSAYNLLQLTSPSLPTGAFTYSQGLEWAVEKGWVTNRQSLELWLQSYIHTGFEELEIPVLQRLYLSAKENNIDNFRYWSNYILACRETHELRLEEHNRGRAMAKLLNDIELVKEEQWLQVIRSSQSAGYTLAAVRWKIALNECLLGYVWSWLENMVMTAVKIIPLGQTQGQKALCNLSEDCCSAIESGVVKDDDEIMGSCPAFALSSSLHETQYTRLFRS